MNYLYYLIALTSLSQAPNLIRLAHSPALVIGFWRLSAASFLLLLFLLWSNKVKTFSQAHRIYRDIPAKGLIFICGSLFFGHLWTYAYGAQTTTVAAAMILFALNPLFTALLSLKLVGDHVPRKVAWAMFLGFLALVLMLIEKHNPQDQSFWGNISAFASGILFSGYILTSKMARQKTENSKFTALMYFVCACWFFVFMIFTERTWLPEHPSFWLATLGLVLFPTFLGHALFSYLLKELNINWMSCGKLLEPGMAALVAYLIFSETPSLAVACSFVLTAIAILMLYLPWEKWLRKY